jgi:hypothetical protein
MTCRANGIGPYAYLNYLFERLPTASTGEQVEALLRWILKAMLDEHEIESVASGMHLDVSSECH